MTANEIDRGGRPRQFDEDELIARIATDEDFLLIQAALEGHSSQPTWAPGCVEWLWRKRAGDPSGGKDRKSATRYRGMLAELPFDPLRPPGGRRRALREALNRGSIHLGLVTGLAGSGAMLAIAAQTPSVALRVIALAAAPIMPERPREAGSSDSGGVVVPLRRVAADGARECVPDARLVPPALRVGYTPLEVAA